MSLDSLLSDTVLQESLIFLLYLAHLDCSRECAILQGGIVPLNLSGVLIKNQCGLESFWPGPENLLSFPPTPLTFFLSSSLPLSVFLFQNVPGWPWTHCVPQDGLHLPNAKSVGVHCHALCFMLCWEWTQHAGHHWAISPVWAFPSPLPCSFTGSHVTQPDLELTIWSRMTLDV